MKLYVLGETKKDKGDQLEQLTRNMLMSQGYNVTKEPEKSIGGFDIDVRANRGLEKIICECKAHKNKINTTDFLKFIGKVYIDNLNDNSTRGIIVALSGVNGNVEGNFNTLKKLKTNLIDLIHGDNLVKWIKESYGAVDEITARQRILKITDRHIKDMSLAYHEINVYWIAFFSDMTFTAFEHNAEDNASENIIEYCKIEIKAFKYVDLKQELYAKSRDAVLKRLIIEELLINPCTIKELTKSINVIITFSLITDEREIKNLIDKIDIIQVTNGVYSLPLNSVSDRSFFYKTILGVSNFITPIFENTIYLDNINEELFLHLLGDIGMYLKENNPTELINCVMALKYSPMALSYLYSDQVLHFIDRPMPAYLKKDANSSSAQIITRNIYNLFLQNLSNPGFYDLYHNVYNIQSIKNRNYYEVKIGNSNLIIDSESEKLFSEINNSPRAPSVLLEKINQK